MSAQFRARRPAPGEPTDVSVYDGRILLGVAKALVDGSFEVFIAAPGDQLEYIAKASSRREACTMLHAARARLRGAPPSHDTSQIDTSARF